ncbi:MAG: hypothetical protein RMJ67_09060 [Elusimicrobiota bacterium]|nr:hypothetical protein [Endomicrobiia bacterium]MDW8166646.1 hypothetical protein [Elusimicrobiota bacterium]
MRLIVIKKLTKPSYRGGFFHYLFFKSLDDGKSYRTCISKEFRNYKWWCDIKVGDVIEVNDVMIEGRLIDADTIPKILSIDSVYTKSIQSIDKV